jgi:hypothetical protein
MSNIAQQKPRRRRNNILATSSVTIGPTPQTHLIDADIFNEPTRERLDMGGNKWVRFFDQNDTFLKSLIAVVNNSPTLRRIINDKTNMVVGDGFIPLIGRPNSNLASRNSEQSTFADEQLDYIETYIDKVNLHQQNLAEVITALAHDFDAFGNCFAELVRGEGFVYIYHTPVYMTAFRKAGDDKVVTSIGIYDNWEEVPLTSEGTQYANKGFREVPIYPRWSEKDEYGIDRSIIHIKQYAAGYFYWGLPEWIAAKQWAEIEYFIQRFNSSKFENGFMPSGLLQFFGSMSNAEAKSLLEAIEKKFTGAGNNHKIFMQVLRDEKLRANWVPMSQSYDGEFLQLQELAASNIVTANRWSKSLAGFAQDGQLGTNQQLRQELEYVQNTVVKPRQNLLLSRIINPYIYESTLVDTNLPAGLQFNISNAMPVSFVGDINIDQSLSVDEKRELLGYSPLGNNDNGVDINAVSNAYGIGVRAGAITSQREDEVFFRNIANLPPMSAAVEQVWLDEGVRRPVTLKSTEEREAELENTQTNEPNTSI